MHDPAPPPPIPRPDLPPPPAKPGPPASYRHVGLVPAAGPARTWGLAVVAAPLLVLLLIGLAVGGSSGGSDSASPQGSSAVLGADTSPGGAFADSSSGGDLLPTWTPQDLPDPATTDPADPADPATDPAGDTDFGTDAATDPAPDPATDPAGATDTPTAYAGSQAVVAAYFDAINNRDYRTAWNLGGSNFAADYDSYVAGFSKTSSDAVTFRSVQGDVVQVYFDAWQTDGTADGYDATFTVSGGRITGGKVTPTS